ncbi:uncharacterized protein LODBEIA_P41150 [Lodderomyces beijingensis]|uniref:Uncharacterized protein n=1 Tax=Lodderomyces beijingensis TaxID=1775926 RepID=A0ABP0ZS24_9ASCO
MSSVKFKLKQHSRALLFTQPVIDLAQTQQSIKSLPNFKSKLRAYYKRFYKLRKFEIPRHLRSTSDIPNQETDLDSYAYVAFVRRQFQHHSYNTKRQKFLNLEPLDDSQLEERMANTLAFVFNHSVGSTSDFSDELVVTVEDEIKSRVDTVETGILATLMRMDYDAPAEIKYDFQFRWVDEYRKKMSPQGTGLQIQNRIQIKTKNEGVLDDYTLIKYFMHGETVMRLNESMKLCLW